MDKSMFYTLSRTFRPSFGLLLKLGATKNRKLRTFCPLENFLLFCTKTKFLVEIMQLSIFLTHKVIPGTFPSLLKVTLGKQSIYLQLNKKYVPQKTANFLIFWHSLPLFISLH